MRAGLRAAEVPYAAAMRWRNWRYDAGRATVHRLPVPVVSVGNLTLGGTGKTPLVEWLARWFLAHGVRVALVSRGYGSKSGAPNDEARELEEKLPDVPHFQHGDRVLAGERAIAETGADLILLDDAFQHRRLARDLDIVLIDACEPFGYEHVFPRGTLREPLAGCRRAHVLALTRADMVSDDERAAIKARYLALAPQAAWLELGQRPRALRRSSGRELPLGELRGQRVAAFCGIGNPAGFRHVIAGSGCELVAMQEFPDHYGYEPADIAELSQWAGSLGVDAVLCTHKDLVKLPVEQLAGKPLLALCTSLDFFGGSAALEAKLSSLVGRTGATQSHARTAA
jgi:tetraacyldisaccharide 4'-kinase